MRARLGPWSEFSVGVERWQFSRNKRSWNCMQNSFFLKAWQKLVLWVAHSKACSSSYLEDPSGMPGWLSGLVPAFGSGCDPGVPGSSPALGSLHGPWFNYLCLCFSLSLFLSHSLYLSWINKENIKKKRPFYSIWYFIFHVVHSLPQGIGKLKFGWVYSSSQPWAWVALNSEHTTSHVEGEWKRLLETQTLRSKMMQYY